MSAQLRCRFCHTSHRAREDKFPLALYGDRNIIDKETKRVVGKTKIIIGYACCKCRRKYDKLKREEAK